MPARLSSARLSSEESGLAGTVLIIIIAWALAAVLLLTATLVAARRIDTSVASITGSVGEIKNDTEAIALTVQIGDATDQIRDAAAPLTGQLDEVLAAAGDILGTVGDANSPAPNTILSTAGAINQTAGTINATVKGINTTVLDIGGTVGSINGNIRAILGVARNINGRSPTGAATTSGVAGINGRADVIIALVTSIRSDLDNVLTQVGTSGASGHGNTIHGHANSINCSPVPNTLGLLAGGFCNQ